MNIILGGIKHCGKSTLGRLLAGNRDSLFIDTDELMEANYVLRTGEPLSCRDIFKKLGEEAFRKLEAEALFQLAESSDEDDQDRVIALGGGVPANGLIAPEQLRKLGVVVFVRIDPRAAWERIAATGTPAYLLKYENPETAFYELCEKRMEYYLRCSHLVFDADPDAAPEENLEALEQLLEGRI